MSGAASEPDLREVSIAIVANQNTRTKSKVTCQTSKKKMREADGAKGGKCMRSAVSARYQRFKICSRLPENVAREIFDQSQTLKLHKNQ